MDKRAARPGHVTHATADPTSLHLLRITDDTARLELEPATSRRHSQFVDNNTVDSTIMRVVDRVVDAWRRRDAGAFAAAFTRDASQILPGGVYLRGREAIRAAIERGLAGPYAGTQLEVRPLDLRQVASDVWVMVSEGGVLPAGRDTIPVDEVVRATWTLTVEDGQWRIAAYQNGLRGAPLDGQSS